MRPIESLRQQLQHMDGKDYGAYQSIKGSYAFPAFEFFIDIIPKDPYAPQGTGIYRARVSHQNAGFPSDMTSSRQRVISLCDYLARQFHKQCLKICKGRRGTGSSGIIIIAEPGQAILERTSILINNDFVEARFFVGLPATGRAIKASLAEKMLLEEIPGIVQASLFAENLDIDAIYQHLKTAEDADFLRDSLSKLNLAAFVSDGAVLPRASGVDPRPLETDSIVPFKSPESLRVSIVLPDKGAVTGMGIPKGVTLIVGGGYHGKSTLLQALESGIYNHIPGDGREYCVSLPETVKVRAYSGRNVVNVDISAFINNIPFEKTTTSFSTENASGSTSQAASIAEIIEAGANVLLMDEDTCAGNFMIRDRNMQRLVLKKVEPITAFVDRVRQLYEDHNISTVLVMGGSGDYFNVSDTVIQMIEFVPYDVKQQAQDIANEHPTGRTDEGIDKFEPPVERIPLSDKLNPFNEYGGFRISAPDSQHLIFGQSKVDLSDVEQLKETAQTKAIGKAIDFAKKYMDGKTRLRDVLDRVAKDIKNDGLDILDQRLTGDLAQFRDLELAATLNRMRDFDAKQVQ
ncbi:MAG: ABC-ATPase domain-containing protein [Candidatus Electryonea clarkiae]|nr:ABC-ATPase domain-containing protein [Candidatus Electryonea clarkiae]MDP8288082.1 ABC-ATPase domain-containing protein [Candidatus Electryonea clarkiae]